jgi:hypothetical protein
VVLMHMVEDAFVNQLIIEKHIVFAPSRELLVSPVNGAISLLLFVAVGIALNRYRTTRDAWAKRRGSPKVAAASSEMAAAETKARP